MSHAQGKRWLILPASAREAAHKGLGKTNELRVVTSGDIATVYINGTQAASLRGYPAANVTMVGLYAESFNEPHTFSFSEFSVRRGPTPASDKELPDDVLFADNFATLDAGWGNTDAAQSVAGNKFIVKPKLDGTRRNLYRGRRFDDVDIRVKVVQREGGEELAGGIIFWGVDYGDYYFALFRTNGAALIGQSIDGTPKVRIQAANKNMNRGLGQSNEIRVLVVGNSATVYVNDQEVGKMTNTAPKGGSMVGVYAESGETAVYTWEFSDFVVRKPK